MLFFLDLQTRRRRSRDGRDWRRIQSGWGCLERTGSLARAVGGGLRIPQGSLRSSWVPLDDGWRAHSLSNLRLAPRGCTGRARTYVGSF